MVGNEVTTQIMAPDGEQIWVPGQSMSRSRSHMSPSPSSPMAAAPTAGKPILSLASRVNIRGSRRVYAHRTLLTSSMFNRCSFCICLLKYFRRLLWATEKTTKSNGSLQSKHYILVLFYQFSIKV